MKKWLAVAALIFLAVKYIEANPTGYQVYTQPGLGAVNESQAAVNQANAAKINQEVRRQNEFDDGTAINVVARVVMGRGLTDAEQLGTTGMIFSAVLCLAPWLALAFLYVIWKLTRPTVVHHD